MKNDVRTYSAYIDCQISDSNLQKSCLGIKNRNAPNHGDWETPPQEEQLIAGFRQGHAD